MDELQMVGRMGDGERDGGVVAKNISHIRAFNLLTNMVIYVK